MSTANNCIVVAEGNYMGDHKFATDAEMLAFEDGVGVGAELGNYSGSHGIYSLQDLQNLDEDCEEAKLIRKYLVKKSPSCVIWDGANHKYLTKTWSFPEKWFWVEEKAQAYLFDTEENADVSRVNMERMYDGGGFVYNLLIVEVGRPDAP